MLKGISPIISPDLLSTLHRMGHGDEIVLSDAHFPAHSINDYVIRADGVEVQDLLKAITPLFELDQYCLDNVVMMKPVSGDTLPEGLVDSYKAQLDSSVEVTYIDRFAFYNRAKNAYCIVVTSTTKKYGNILLKKGVIEN